MEFYKAGERAGFIKGEARIVRQEMPGRPKTCWAKSQYPQGKADSWGQEIDAAVESMSQQERHEQKLREVHRDYEQRQCEMPRAYDNNSREMGGYYGYQQSPPPPPYPHGGYSTRGGYGLDPYERRDYYY